MEKKGVIIGVIVIVLVLALFGWLFMRSRSSSDDSSMAETTEEVFVTTAPEPTEEPDYELTDYSIQVLNGSGTAGIAGKLQTALEDAGFAVEGTGNADNYDYDTTVLQTKSTVPSGYVDELTSALEGEYGDVTVETLDDEEETDVVVIIGGQQEEETVEEDVTEEETSEPTPTTSEEEVTPTPEA